MTKKSAIRGKRVKAKTNATTSRYRQRRVVQSWNAAQRAYVSCLAIAAFDDGKRGAALIEAVGKIVPKWRSLFNTPPSDAALISRAHNSRVGPTSKKEAPEVSHYKKAIWPTAKKDYKTGKRTLGLDRNAMQHS